MMGYYGYGYNDGFSFFGPLMMLIFWVVVIWLIVLMVRTLSGKSMHYHQHDEAMMILRERFAKGEINKAEYEERRKALELEK